jgi:hypothetical protein
MDEFGYDQHSFKKEFKFPKNLVLEKEHKTESTMYDHTKLDLELQRIKLHYLQRMEELDVWGGCMET